MRHSVLIRSTAGLFLLSLLLAGWGAAHGKKDWPVPEAARKLRNPVPANPSSLAVAKAIYLDKCAQCHGEQGKGDGPESVMYDVKPADFTDAHMMAEMTDGEIFWKLTEGRRPMPSFKKQLTEEQRWQLVHYVRAFTPKPARPKAARSAQEKKKSPARSSRP